MDGFFGTDGRRLYFLYDWLYTMEMFCSVEPLQRPRFGLAGGTVRQSLANQRDLLHAMSKYKLDSPFKTRTGFHVEIYIEKHIDNDKRYDLDNAVKAVLDAMQKYRIIVNDGLIRSINARIFDECKDDYLRVDLFEARMSGRIDERKELNEFVKQHPERLV